MPEVSFSASFKRAFRKRIAPDRKRTEKFWRTVEIFRNNPYDPSLRTHKLSGKLKELLSFTVEYDLRIVFYFSEPDTAIFIDIGSHDEVY